MHVLYIVKRPVVARDFERYGMATMLERGYAVTVLDLSRALHPDLSRPEPVAADHPNLTMHEIARIEDLDDARSLFEKADLAFLLIQSYGLAPSNIRVLRILAETGTPYLIMAPALFPGWNAAEPTPTLSARFRGVVARLRDANFRNSLVHRLPTGLLGIPKASFVIYNSLESAADNNLVGPGTVPIHAHTFDYDLYLRDRNQPTNGAANHAVFVDQYAPFHEDYRELNARPIDAGAYFSSLRRVFDEVEHALGLEVVIAAHPRADYSNLDRPFGDRRMIAGETMRLIRDSSLVMLHTSTVVGYAVLFRKPVMVLTSDALYHRQSYERHFYEAFSRVLGTQLRFMDSGPGELRLKDALTIDEAAYDRYVDQYMRYPGSPDRPLWDIVLDAIGQRERHTA